MLIRSDITSLILKKVLKDLFRLSERQELIPGLHPCRIPPDHDTKFELKPIILEEKIKKYPFGQMSDGRLSERTIVQMDVWRFVRMDVCPDGRLSSSRISW